MIQPNTDMTGTGSAWVGIAMSIVTSFATKPAQTITVCTTRTCNFILDWCKDRKKQDIVERAMNAINVKITLKTLKHVFEKKDTKRL